MYNSDSIGVLLPSHCGHLPPEKGDLRGKRQVLGADVVATQEPHAAEHAIVVADQFVEILIATLITGVKTKTGNLVQPHRVHFCRENAQAKEPRRASISPAA